LEKNEIKELDMYAVVNNDIVTKIISCPEKPGGATAYPDDAQIYQGCDVRFFSSAGLRLTAAEAEAANLISVGSNQIAVWENGKYVVKHDYTSVNYWEKATGNPRKLEVGESPDSTLTTTEPPDPEAVWQSNSWVIPNAVKAKKAREKRNELLLDSDCVVLEDYPIDDKTAWKAYRQALRDVPGQASFPGNINWPVAPT